MATSPLPSSPSLVLVRLGTALLATIAFTACGGGNQGTVPPQEPPEIKSPAPPELTPAQPQPGPGDLVPPQSPPEPTLSPGEPSIPPRP
ncbi:hypothetical protein [Chondromyces crocatus]|uniref:hypothetical protein n=1 Tax=Chondromyces crocatus TaxID=52 RepID=UPI0012E2867C|nr:hypothetical protein [Chondromyces crocatus]